MKPTTGTGSSQTALRRALAACVALVLPASCTRYDTQVLVRISTDMVWNSPDAYLLDWLQVRAYLGTSTDPFFVRSYPLCHGRTPQALPDGGFDCYTMPASLSFTSRGVGAAPVTVRVYGVLRGQDLPGTTPGAAPPPATMPFTDTRFQFSPNQVGLVDLLLAARCADPVNRECPLNTTCGPSGCESVDRPTEPVSPTDVASNDALASEIFAIDIQRLPDSVLSDGPQSDASGDVSTVADDVLEPCVARTVPCARWFTGYADPLSTPPVAPQGLVITANGASYFADPASARVFRFTSGSALSVVVGTGIRTTSGNGSDGTLGRPDDLAWDETAQTLYIADGLHRRIYRWNAPGGALESLTTDPIDNAAEPASPIHVALQNRSLFFATNREIYELSLTAGATPTLRAGSSTCSTPDVLAAVAPSPVPGASACFGPIGDLVATSTELYVSEPNECRVRSVDLNHLVNRVVGSHSCAPTSPPRGVYTGADGFGRVTQLGLSDGASGSKLLTVYADDFCALASFDLLNPVSLPAVLELGALNPLDSSLLACNKDQQNQARFVRAIAWVPGTPSTVLGWLDDEDLPQLRIQSGPGVMPMANALRRQPTAASYRTGPSRGLFLHRTTDTTKLYWSAPEEQLLYELSADGSVAVTGGRGLDPVSNTMGPTRNLPPTELSQGYSHPSGLYAVSPDRKGLLRFVGDQVELVAGQYGADFDPTTHRDGTPQGMFSFSSPQAVFPLAGGLVVLDHASNGTAELIRNISLTDVSEPVTIVRSTPGTNIAAGSILTQVIAVNVGGQELLLGITSPGAQVVRLDPITLDMELVAGLNVAFDENLHGPDPSTTNPLAFRFNHLTALAASSTKVFLADDGFQRLYILEYIFGSVPARFELKRFAGSSAPHDPITVDDNLLHPAWTITLASPRALYWDDVAHTLYVGEAALGRIRTIVFP